MIEIEGLLVGAFAFVVVGCGGVSADQPGSGHWRTPAATTGFAPSRPAPNAPAAGPSGLSPAPSASTPSDDELPYCPGKGTSRIRIQANIDASALVPTLAFDTVDPANTSNFSTRMIVYTADGSAHSLEVYFAKEADDTWDYHVLVGTPIELGNGVLVFDGGGALLHHREREPVKLVGAHGFESVAISFGTPIDRGGSGLDGTTQIDGPSNVGFQDQDGIAAVVGSPCPGGEQLPDVPVRPATAAEQALLDRFGMCGPAATQRVRVRANLAAAAAPVSVPWEAKNPVTTSNLSLAFSAHDEAGKGAEFGLYFSKIEQGIWDYHVLLLVSSRPGPELANGRLEFQDNGALASVVERTPLYFPRPDGARGGRIELDLGGAGTDGLTSFETKSYLSEVTKDGHGVALGAECTESDASIARQPWELPIRFENWGPWGSPDCGAGSTYLKLTWFVSTSDQVYSGPWAIGAPTSIFQTKLNMTVYDGNARPVDVEVGVRRSAEAVWQLRLLNASTDPPTPLALLSAYFEDDQISPSRVEGPDHFRLPLVDGSAGPLIRIDSQLWRGGSNQLELSSDGAPSSCAH